MAFKPFILIVGPTASGKSSLGDSLAAQFGGAILNCDSLQTYCRLDIGTAKPTREQRAKIPHFLFDVLGPGEILTAGDFRKMALEILARELPQRMVFGVGGSGFYIQALEKGMFEVEKSDIEVDRAVREELAEKGLTQMYEKLRRQDPEYADVLNPNDAYRITRALVMIAGSGKTVTELRAGFQRQAFPYPLLKLGVQASREQLLPRIEQRTREMFAQGFLEEVRTLKEEGYASWAPMQSVGYKECLMHLNGEITFEQLIALVNEKTLQLAKKQRTWFKRDPEIHWLDLNDPLPEAQKLITEFLA